MVYRDLSSIKQPETLRMKIDGGKKGYAVDRELMSRRYKGNK